MKFRFSKSAGRLRMKALTLLFGLILSPFTTTAQPQLFFINNGTINNGNLQSVDAINDVNNGIWDISTSPALYETADTLYYTNEGSMFASPGWNFDLNPSSVGVRGMSAIFFNDNYNPNNNNAGLIQAGDGFIYNPPAYNGYTASYLWISATNIINQGLLEATANGEIVLNGQNVLLGRSALEISPIAGVGTTSSGTNGVNDVGIYDESWSVGGKLSLIGSYNGFGTLFLTNGGAAEPCVAQTTNVIIISFPQLVDSFTNAGGAYTLTYTNMQGQPISVSLFSNVVRQAVFVQYPSSIIQATDHFYVPSRGNQYINAYSNYLFRPVVVRFAMVSTNFITLTLQTNFLYLMDDLASTSNNQFLVEDQNTDPSSGCSSPTFRPSSVLVSRTDPYDPYYGLEHMFALGVPGLGTPPGNFFYDPTFTNFAPTGIFNTYSNKNDYLPTEIPPGGSLTNLPGRIRIYANNLDLSKTRMSSQAYITMQASNLIGSAGAIMDCQNLSYNFGSTNGLLTITNLSLSSVSRLHGTLAEWSFVWTNYFQTVYPAYSYDMMSSQYDISPLTNTTEVDMSFTVVNADGLSTTEPVTVQDLILNSTNIIIGDYMNVVNSLLLNGQAFTLTGTLDLSGEVQTWTYANAPALLYFTNSGTLDIPNEAHFGDDGPTNYAVFVNDGTIESAGQTINSRYLQIGQGGGSGNDTSTGDFAATCQTGAVINASIISSGNIQFHANSLQFKSATLSATRTLSFWVTNSLTDGRSTCSFTCQNGFNLYTKPATGDLLGTTIKDVAVGESEVKHTWAGLDFGTNVMGYSNNVAISTLVLSTNQTLPGFEPLFHFTGAGADNGMYVSNLDLSLLDDYANEIEIDPNLTIYFVSAKLNPAVNTGILTPEQFLDGQFGGHLRWVQGVTSLVTTFSGSYSTSGGGKFQLNLSGVPSGQTNIIEASTNLVNWIPIYTNIGSMIFTDSAAKNYPYRFYRAEPSP